MLRNAPTSTPASQRYSAALRREKLLSQADAEQEKVVADNRVGDPLRHLSARWIRPPDLRSNAAKGQASSLATAMRAAMSWLLTRKRATTPTDRAYPSTRRLACSAACSSFWIRAVRERVDRRISAPATHSLFRIPELGVIPLDEAVISRQIGNGRSRIIPRPFTRAAHRGPAR